MNTDVDSHRQVAIIGGGPAGLMAAEVLSSADLKVSVFEAKPSVGRKFLVAGKGGLNLSHVEEFSQFIERYQPLSEQLRSALRKCGPDEVRRWCEGLGIDTFVGPSQRLFPAEMKATPLLRAWLQRLRFRNVQFQTGYRWTGWSETDDLTFSTQQGAQHVKADAVILALGGASWPKLGSDGTWVSLLTQRGIEVAPLKPTNCGFEVSWSEHLRSKFAGAPLKSVLLRFTNSRGETFSRRGAMVVTEYGLEGGVLYAASALIRDEIAAHGQAIIEIDLAPDVDLQTLESRLNVDRGSKSLSRHLRSKAKLHGVETALLYELAHESTTEMGQLARAIKGLRVPLDAPRPIAEAISTAGGVRFEELTDDLMLRSHPGLFCAGEMLNWEAPTGGYLLTACLSTGQVVGTGVLRWLEQSSEQSRKSRRQGERET